MIACTRGPLGPAPSSFKAATRVPPVGPPAASKRMAPADIFHDEISKVKRYFPVASAGLYTGLVLRNTCPVLPVTTRFPLPSVDAPALKFPKFHTVPFEPEFAKPVVFGFSAVGVPSNERPAASSNSQSSSGTGPAYETEAIAPAARIGKKYLFMLFIMEGGGGGYLE